MLPVFAVFLHACVAAAAEITSNALQAVAIKDLPLPSDAQKLQLAFALWAEGLAASVPQQQQQAKQAKTSAASGKQQQKVKQPPIGKQKPKRPAEAAAAIGSDGGDDNHTATSSGKARPSKKVKA